MDDTFEAVLVRDKIPIRSIASSFMLDESTGYIKITRFSGTTMDEFDEAMDKLNSSGWESLTEQEERYLKHASNKLFGDHFPN